MVEEGAKLLQNEVVVSIQKTVDQIIDEFCLFDDTFMSKI